MKLFSEEKPEPGRTVRVMMLDYNGGIHIHEGEYKEATPDNKYNKPTFYVETVQLKGIALMPQDFWVYI